MGHFKNRKTPVRVKDLTDVIAIAGGYLHSLALKSDGTVWAWGNNYYGQLGNGLRANSTAPVLVNGLSNVSKIQGGYIHSLALVSDGTVWTWGNNQYGQLGDGSTIEERRTPVQVMGIGI